MEDGEGDQDDEGDQEQTQDQDHPWKSVSPPQAMIESAGKKRKRPPPLANIVRSPRFLLAGQATLPDPDAIPIPTTGPLPGEDEVDLTSPLNDTLFSADIGGSQQPSPLSALFPNHGPANASTRLSPMISAQSDSAAAAKRAQSPQIDTDPFFQPTHMAYSLAQHFRVGSEEVEV